MSIFDCMVGKPLEEQVRLFRNWIRTDSQWYEQLKRPEPRLAAWLDEQSIEKIVEITRKLDREEWEAKNKEYNDNKDNIQGPYAGGRQW